MILSELGRAGLRSRLARNGLVLRIGPYRVRAISRLAEVADGLELLYASFPVEASAAFSDFALTVSRYRGSKSGFRSAAILTIDAEKPFLPVPRGQAYPFFEWGLNWCIANRALDVLLFHSAVVEREGRAVLLAGTPGSGKSTLCAGLVKRGWRLLSDEFGILDPATGRLLPLPRPISLKNRSIDIIAEIPPDLPMTARVPDTAKGVIALMAAPGEAVAAMEAAAAPALVLFPRYNAAASMDLNRLSDGDAFAELTRHSFNYGLLGAAGFEALTNMVRGCSAFSIEYSNLHDAIRQVESLVDSPQPHATALRA